MMDGIRDTIKRMLAPVERRVMNMIARGVIESITDTAGIQKVKLSLLADEILEGKERIQEYGFTSVPLAGAEAVMIFLGGNRDHGVIIATDDRRTRLKSLLAGDVALWTASGGKLILRNADKKLEGLVGKIAIANASDDLITVLSDLCAWLQSAHVITAMGPQPFTPTDLTSLGDIKDRLDTFKV